MKQFTRFATALAVAGGLSLAAGTANALTIDYLFDNEVGNDTSAGSDSTGAMLRPMKKVSIG